MSDQICGCGQIYGTELAVCSACQRSPLEGRAVPASDELACLRDRVERAEARRAYIKADSDGTRSLLLLLQHGKGTPDDFDKMVDRIIESRRGAGIEP